MSLIRRSILTVICGFSLAFGASAQDDPASHQHRLMENMTAPEGLRPGDTKFMHSFFHDLYPRLPLEVNSTSTDLQPGDRGFHPELRESYQFLYAGTKCNCDYGSCRPTQLRITAERPVPAGQSGYEVLIDGQWYPVPQSSLHQEKDLTADLWLQLMENLPPGVNGHVCAFPSSSYPNGMNIECVIAEQNQG